MGETPPNKVRSLQQHEVSYYIVLLAEEEKENIRRIVREEIEAALSTQHHTRIEEEER